MNWSYLKYLVISLLATIALQEGNGQIVPLSGVVNNYAKALKTTFSNCRLECDQLNGFQKNDRLLIIQMKGAKIDTTNNIGFGKVLDFGMAGMFEVGEVDSIDGNIIVLKKQLLNPYNFKEYVQVVGFSPLTEATVIDEIKAMPWDGDKGGIVFMDVSDRLILNAGINVVGAGFRGGKKSKATVNCGASGYKYTYASGDGGQKGDSYIIRDQYDSGRGPWASSGGGGNNHNTGGGGGSHFGIGGKGGFDDWVGCGQQALDLGGLPGHIIDYNIAKGRMFLGSGGGGAQQNNSYPFITDTAEAGSPGGGVIFLRTESLVGNDFVLDASGMNQDSLAINDPGGGGGSGGTIFLDAAIQGGLELRVQGGKGSSVNNFLLTGFCQGPGGGGGGGVIQTTSASIGSNVIMTLSGGKSGEIISPNSISCYQNSGGKKYGATDGFEGGAVFNVTVPKGTVPCNPEFNLVNDFEEVIGGECVSLDLKQNDFLEVSNTLTFCDSTNHGTIERISDAEVMFCADTGYVGLDSLCYSVCIDVFPFNCKTAMTYYTISKPIDCNIDIFNGISPNGDGVNDLFLINGISCYPNSIVKIFNSWGNMVYEAKGYDNELIVWKGQANTGLGVEEGQLLPFGTYYFIIELEPGDVRTGFIVMNP